jgi:nitrile hydratase accessory protein
LTAEPQAVAALPHLLRDDGGPVFAEPWQAQAFALVVELSKQGHFTWKEWASALALELQTAANRGEPDDGSRYYEHWLAALERLVTAKGLADSTALITRKQAWTEAYRYTPHGRPVEFPIAPAKAGGRLLFLGLASAVAAYLLVRASWQPFSGPQERFVTSAGLGTLLGMRHALEPDHLAALSTLLTGERNIRKAAWLGVYWGIGHTLTLLVAGTLLVVLRADMPALAADVLAGAVVLLLARRPLLLGAVHGLAGSGALTALVMGTIPSMGARLIYLLLFGVGSTLGMAALSGLMGWPIARVGAHGAVARCVSLAVGCISIMLGLYWGYPLTGRLF